MVVTLLAVACGGQDTGEPEEEPPGGPTTGWTEGGSFEVGYETVPSPIPLSEDFVLRTRVTDTRGVWVEDASVVVNAEMPTHEHGMNTIPVTTFVGDGWYETTGMLFHMPGPWQITFDISTPDVYETAVMPYECCF
jgi:hypothetical protein